MIFPVAFIGGVRRPGERILFSVAKCSRRDVGCQCARDGAMSGRWKSSFARFADRVIVEYNCVCENRGGEQWETKVTSVR